MIAIQPYYTCCIWHRRTSRPIGEAKQPSHVAEARPPARVRLCSCTASLPHHFPPSPPSTLLSLRCTRAQAHLAHLLQVRKNHGVSVRLPRIRRSWLHRSLGLGSVPHLGSTSDEHPPSLASTVGHTDAGTMYERSLAAKLAAAQAAGASATPGYGKPPGAAAASPYPPATGAGHAAAAFPGQQPSYSQQPGQYGGAGGYGGQPPQQQQQQGACRRSHPFGSASPSPGQAKLIDTEAFLAQAMVSNPSMASSSRTARLPFRAVVLLNREPAESDRRARCRTRVRRPRWEDRDTAVTFSSSSSRTEGSSSSQVRSRNENGSRHSGLAH